MENILKLIGIEYQISRVYKYLSNFEKEVNNDDADVMFEVFTSLVNDLKMFLEEEDKLLKSLTKENIDNINYIITHGGIKFDSIEEDDFSDMVQNRIDYRINGDNPNLDNDVSLKIANYIMDDYDNYYLSFIDEWINKEDNKKVKDSLILNKYKCIFLSSREAEQSKILNSFKTDKSVYTLSYFMSQIYNVPYSEYAIYRNRHASSKIVHTLDKISSLLILYNENYDNNIFKSLYKLYAYELRSAFLLLTGDERDELFNRITYEDTSFKKEIGNIFDDDFDDIINKDNERHKLLWLNK